MSDQSLDNISFAPIENRHAQILILGSMPGIKSLQEQQYYAHPRNSFWPIMAHLLNFDVNLSYKNKCQKLIKHHIAVWDVLKSCQRPGSLDQHIEDNTMVVNDFTEFLNQHPHIQSLFFNGTKAKQIFKKHVLPQLTTPPFLSYSRLPSTSPAHASMSFENKLQHWQQIQLALVEANRPASSLSKE
jgi:hypoxanthine-DNA glycosylase